MIPQEPAHEVDDTKPDPEWPEDGSIQFEDITMSYRKGLPDVLKGISLDVKGGEKIGVVGRTGAGKSSLTLCLLRIVEYQGKIAVDEYVVFVRSLSILTRSKRRHWQDW